MVRLINNCSIYRYGQILYCRYVLVTNTYVKNAVSKVKFIQNPNLFFWALNYVYLKIWYFLVVCPTAFYYPLYGRLASTHGYDRYAKSTYPQIPTPKSPKNL